MVIVLIREISCMTLTRVVMRSVAVVLHQRILAGEATIATFAGQLVALLMSFRSIQMLLQGSIVNKAPVAWFAEAW